MKKISVFLLLFLCIDALQAQQDIKLPGIVVEQNSQYRTGSIKYLSNTEVKSAGATPQRSDANGQFTLVFADRPGGDVARVFAVKSGYEVVNEEELKQASIIGRLRPLKIVMCEQGKLYENQIAYYNIARDASLDAYKRKVAALQQDSKEQQRLIAELRVQFNHDFKTKEEAIVFLDQQRQIAEKQAKELADKFVTENLDDQSPAYQRAFSAFEARNIELAKAILDSVDLEKRLALNSSAKAKEQVLVATLQKGVNERAEEIRQDVNMCLFKARLHNLEYEWAKADRYYDLAMAYDSSNFEVVFEVASYMHSRLQFAKARTYYEKALKISLPSIKGLVLIQLGELLQVTNEMGSAKQAFEEALQINRELAEKNPEEYLGLVLNTLITLGNFFLATNDMGSAIQSMYEAAQIINNSEENNFYFDPVKLPRIFLHFADFYEKFNELGTAKVVLEEALLNNRELAEKNPDVYLPHVAITLNNLGRLLPATNEIGTAKQAYEEALQINRKLAEKNPDVYLPQLAWTLNNLGGLLQATNEIGTAKQAYEEALQINRKLAEKNPDVYAHEVAKTLNNLGGLLELTNEIGNAKQAYEEALLINRELVEKNPVVYAPEVAKTLNNLGGLLQLTKEIGNAKQAYEEALQINRKLAEKNPDVYLPHVAITLNNLGVLLPATNEIGTAKQAFEEALQINRKLAEKNPDVYLPQLAWTLYNLGDLLMLTNELGRAKQAYEEALLINRKLAEKNPDVYLPHVAITLNNLGDLLRLTNELGKAKQAYEEALLINRELAKKNPQVFNLLVTTIDISIGYLYIQCIINTGEMALKGSVLDLIRDAEQHLAIFPEAHPQVQKCRNEIQRLTRFFKNFDEAAFQLKEYAGDLEMANKTEKDPYKKVQRQQEIISLLSEIEKAIPGDKWVVTLMANNYGSLSWYQLFTRQFDGAEQSARTGLNKDPSEEWINTNLALSLLYQGKWEAAKLIYETLKEKSYGDKTYRAIFLEDLEALEKEGITHPDVVKVRKLLGKK